MARYIDADKVMEEINRIGGHNLCEWETLGVKALIDRQPTADVVPKSEVAKEFTCFVGDPHKVEHCPYLDEIENAKTEVAREIFELIECAFSPALDYNGYTIKAYLAELKKKYTEGKEK